MLILLMGLVIINIRLQAFELASLSRSSGESGEIITTNIQFAPPFGAATSIDVVFLQRIGGVLTEVNRSAAAGFVANLSVSALVPNLAIGDYEITIELDGIVNDDTDPPFRQGLAFLITPARPFNFTVNNDALPDWNIASGTNKNIEFGDIDNDGDLDIYAFNSLSGSFVDRLATNNGGAQGGNYGEFSLSSGLPAIPAGAAGDDFNNEFVRTYDGDLVDVNGDGVKDALRADRNGIHLFINQGDGTFINRADLLPNNDEILNGTGIAGFSGIGGVIDFDGVDTADVDNDGDLDAVLANYFNEGGGVRGESLYLINQINGAAGKFVIANRDGDVWEDIRDDMTHGVVFGDVDGDGDADVFLTNTSDGQKNRLLINSGLYSGVFIDETDARLPAGTVNSRTSVDGLFRDFDGDGDNDLYLVDRNTSNNVFWNDGAGNFTDLGDPNLPDQPASGSRTYGLSAIDIDYDGDIDLIDAPGESGNITQESRILLNLGGTDANLRFTVKTDAFLPNAAHRLTIDVGDIDFDLDMDLIGGSGANNIVLYENDLFDNMAEDADIVIMLDHTGSMITSSHDYLEPVKNIAKAILARKRIDDRIGLVLFNYRGSETNQTDADDPSEDSLKAQTIITLEQSESMTSMEIENIIDSIDEGPCAPGGCTAIGQGLRQGLAEIKPNLNPERVKILVLLTDGAQNMLPSTQTVVGEIVGGFPSNVHVYAIALGTDTDNQELADLSSLGSGFYQDVDALNMATIFENIESDATEKQILTTKATLQGGKEVDEGSFVNPQLIDFNNLDLGEVVFEQYSKNGLRLGNNVTWIKPTIVADLQDDPNGEFDQALRSAFNLDTISGLIENNPSILKTLRSPLTFHFNRLQKRVGLTAKLDQGNRTTAVLQLFDVHGDLLGTVRKTIDFGSDAFLGFESNAGTIAKAQLSYSGINHIELIDDLMYEAGSTFDNGRSFFVGAQDKQIRVGLTWQNPNINPGFTLIKPSGATMLATEIEVRESKGSVFHIFEIKAPEVGTWQAKITGIAQDATVLSVLASSGLKLGLNPDKHRWTPNEQMTLTASLGSIVDGKLKPISNADFKIQVERPDGYISSSTALVEPQSNGLYGITLIDTALSGVYNILVTVMINTGTDYQQSRSRRLSLVSSRQRAGDACNDRSRISATPTKIVADGSSTAIITAHIVDCSGRPWKPQNDQKLTFWANGGKLAGAITNSQPGTFTQTLVAPKIPTKIKIQPVIGARKLNISTTVKIVTGVVDPKRTRVYLASSPGFVHADGKGEGAIVIIPVDANDNHLGQGHDVQCQWINTEISRWLGAAFADVDGSYSRAFVAGNTSGTSTAYCTVNGVVIDETVKVNFFVPNDEVLDSDGDGIINWSDNCPFVANPQQTDSNNNQAGDACEVEKPEQPDTITVDAKEKYHNFLMCLLLFFLLLAIFIYWRKK